MIVIVLRLQTSPLFADSPVPVRGYARAYLKDLEAIRPTSIIDIIHSGESLAVRDAARLPTQGTCSRCQYISSQPVCKACVLLQGLNQVGDRPDREQYGRRVGGDGEPIRYGGAFVRLCGLRFGPVYAWLYWLVLCCSGVWSRTYR